MTAADLRAEAVASRAVVTTLGGPFPKRDVRDNGATREERLSAHHAARAELLDRCADAAELVGAA